MHIVREGSHAPISISQARPRCQRQWGMRIAREGWHIGGAGAGTRELFKSMSKLPDPNVVEAARTAERAGVGPCSFHPSPLPFAIDLHLPCLVVRDNRALDDRAVVLEPGTGARMQDGSYFSHITSFLFFLASFSLCFTRVREEPPSHQPTDPPTDPPAHQPTHPPTNRPRNRRPTRAPWTRAPWT